MAGRPDSPVGDRNTLSALIILALLLALPEPACPAPSRASFKELRMGGHVAGYQGKMRKAAREVLTGIPGIHEELESRLGLKPDFPVTVLIYRDEESFSRMSDNRMIAALARPDANLVALNFPAVSTHPLDVKAVMTHELCHLLLHRHIPRQELPKWFDEGVSQWASGGITELIHPATGDVLRKALLGNRLIPFFRLADRFPEDETGFRLAYEQSSSLVTFIARNYGEDSLRGIIARLAGGTTFPEAVEAEILLSPAGLEAAWKESLGRRPEWIRLLADNIYVFTFLVGAVALVAGFLRLRYRMRTYGDDEEEDENHETPHGLD